MQIAKTIGHEIRDYIMTLLNHDSFVVDSSGICIASPNEEMIGTKVNFSKDLKKISAAQEIKAIDQNWLIIPLEYENNVVAYLAVQSKNGDEKNYLSLIKSFSELLIQQYYENNKPNNDSTDQFVIKLINNAGENDYPLYESEASVLGYDLSVPRLSIVIHLEGFWEKCLLSIDQPSFERDEVIKNMKRSIENAVNGFFSKNNDVITAYVGNDRFVVFKAVTEADEASVIRFLKQSFKSIFDPLKNYRISSVSVGFGRSHTSAKGLVSGFREANLALELGQKIWGNGKGYYFYDLGILTIIGEGDREKNLQFAKQMLDCMKNKDLNDTLECFFDQNLNLTETAEKLGVHRNTIIYRLNQISKILGADPRIFEHAMSIKIALLIKQLFA